MDDSNETVRRSDRGRSCTRSTDKIGNNIDADLRRSNRSRSTTRVTYSEETPLKNNLQENSPLPLEFNSNLSGNDSISSNASIEEIDKILTPSQSNVRKKLTKAESNEISQLNLQNFHKVEHILNKSNDPSDIFTHFKKVTLNSLKYHSSKGHKVTKHLVSEFENATNYISSKIAEATRTQHYIENLNKDSSPISEALFQIQERIENMTETLTLIQDSTKLTSNNTTRIPEIVGILPKIKDTLTLNEKTLREAMDTMTETQRTIEALNSSTKVSMDYGAGILNNIQDLTRTTYDNMVTITKNTFQSMEQTTQKSLENIGTSISTHSKMSTNNKEDPPKKNNEQVFSLKLTHREESPNEDAKTYLQNFFKTNSLPSPTNLIQNKFHKLILFFKTLEEQNIVKQKFLESTELQDNFRVHEHSGQRLRIIIFNTLLSEERNEQLYILNSNDTLKTSNVKVIKSYKNRKTNKINLIIELDKPQGDLLLQNRSIFLDFQRYSLAISKEIKRCYKCQAFGHYSNFCKEKQACQNCGEGHNSSECKSDKVSCINCVKNDESDSSHSANSLECPSYKAYRNSIFSQSS